jgi:lipopolysaccharide transport system ATP-binding protein
MASETVIRADGVSKRYELGHAGPGTLAEKVINLMRGRSGTEFGPPVIETEPFWALRDVSIDVRRGEVVGLVGRNGAGKSTLLKLLAGISYPTEGRISITGRVGTLLEVGTGFQPELTGRENVYLSGTILGMRRKEIHRRFWEIVDFSGVEKFIDTPVKRYSSGMTVRLGFAVAAHLTPEILLVDEVLAVGDAEFQRRCLAKMKNVVDEGRTIVFVSHGMQSVQDICDRAYWIDGGRVAAEGPTRDVIAAYLKLVEMYQQAGSVVVVDPKTPRVGSGAATIERVEVARSDPGESNVLRMGEPLTIHLDLRVRSEIPDALLEVGISTVEGLRLLTATNMDDGRAATRFAPGLVRVSVTIDVALLPGEFVVELGVHRSISKKTIDHLERVLRFEVSGKPFSERDRSQMDPIRGLFRPAARWEVLPNNG